MIIIYGIYDTEKKELFEIGMCSSIDDVLSYKNHYLRDSFKVIQIGYYFDELPLSEDAFKLKYINCKFEECLKLCVD